MATDAGHHLGHRILHIVFAFSLCSAAFLYYLHIVFVHSLRTAIFVYNLNIVFVYSFRSVAFLYDCFRVRVSQYGCLIYFGCFAVWLLSVIRV